MKSNSGEGEKPPAAETTAASSSTDGVAAAAVEDKDRSEDSKMPTISEEVVGEE